MALEQISVMSITQLVADLAAGKKEDSFAGFSLRILVLFFLICWMAYFHISARVKATFGANL